MRTSFNFHKDALFTSIAGKIFLLTVLTLFCFTGSLFAGVKPGTKDHKGGKTAVSKKQVSAEATIAPGAAALPVVSYAGPQTYVAGTAISPLSPTATGAAAPVYNTVGITLATGLNDVSGVTVDAQGNIYIADTNNHVIKKIAAGTTTPVTLPGTFFSPSGITADASGNVFVADKTANVIQEIPANGGPVISIGTDLSQVGDVAYSNGYLYVADQGNNEIKQICACGGSSIIKGSGFSKPSGVAIDSKGNIYVADFGNSVVKEILTGGTIVILNSTVQPYHLTVDATGNVFVTGFQNGLFEEIPAGGATPTTVLANSNIRGVAVDAASNLLITDTVNNVLKKLQPTGPYSITPALPPGLSFNVANGTISGTPLATSPATTYTVTVYNQSGSTSTTVNIAVNAVTLSYPGPQSYVAGSPITALAPVSNGITPVYGSITTVASGLHTPLGIVADAQGNIFFCDATTNTIKKIPAGTGTPVVIGTGFNEPYGIAIDAAGNLYVADENSKTVKEIPANGGATITLGSNFSSPAGVAVDSYGNVYVADGCIKKIPAGGGLATTVTCTYSSYSVAVDAKGDLFLGTTELFPNGTAATIGSGITQPVNTAVDAVGNVFVTDLHDRTVKEILAGNGQTITIASGFTDPSGVAVDNAGNVYVTDPFDNVVKKISATGIYNITPALPSGLNFNVANGAITGTPSAASPATTYTVTATTPLGGSVTATVNIGVVPFAVSYAGPQTFAAGHAVTPVIPVSSGIAPPLYNTASTYLVYQLEGTNHITSDSRGDIYIVESGFGTPSLGKVLPGADYVTLISYGSFSLPEGIAADAVGNVYVADFNTTTIWEVPASGGPIVTIGSGFKNPTGVAVDSNGNIYVADQGNNAVKKIPAGGGPVITLGSGFNQPSDIAVDSKGNIYVADYGNSAIKEIRTDGTLITISPALKASRLAVDGGGNVFAVVANRIEEIPVNGGSPVLLSIGSNSLGDVAIDGANNLYAADVQNKSLDMIKPSGPYTITQALPSGLSFNVGTGIIYGTPLAASLPANFTITASNPSGITSTTLSISVTSSALSYAGAQTYTAGTAITPLAPTGSSPAAPGYSAASTILGSGFNLPAGLAVDAQGNVYVADQGNNAVKKIPNAGTLTTIGAGFNTPKSVAVDAAGNVYVADEGNNQVKEIPAGSGAVLIIGSGFLQPYSVAVDNLGNVYVADKGHNAVKEIPVNGGAVITLGSGFNAPTGVAVDAYGNVYVADNGNGAVKEILTNGTISTLGSGISSPYALSVDGTGNIFVADNVAGQVKEIPVGNGTPILVAAGFNALAGVAVDNANNLYVSVDGSSTVKKIEPSGGYYISLALPKGLGFNNNTGAISGTPTAATPAADYTVTAYNQYGSFSNTVNITVNAVKMSYASPQAYLVNTLITPLSPTGGGAAAPGYSNSSTILGSGFNLPAGLATDAQGNVYVADQGNNVVKKIPGGTGAPIIIGTGFNTPKGVAVDGAGNIYVADEANNLVKQIPAGGGAIVTLGSGFLQPYGVAVDTKGNVYVADKGNNAIKEIPAGGGAVITLGSGFNGPTGVAVDAYGNVYVADNGNGAVKEIPAGNGAPVIIGSGISNPYALTVDGTGNVFVADNVANQVKEIPVGNGTPILVAASFNLLAGLAVDNANNMYVSVDGSSTVKKIQPTGGYYISQALPQGLNFSNTTGTISGTPIVFAAAANYTVTAYNQYGSNAAALNITVNTVTTDATLSGLSPNNGILKPAFSPVTTSYVISVGNTTASMTVTPVSTQPAATITVNGAAVSSGTVSGPIALAEGIANPINVVVTAADGVTTKTYTVTAIRSPSTDATLTGIGSSLTPLTPAFSPAVTNYTIDTTGAITKITVQPVTTDPNATIKVNGTTLRPGITSNPITLTGASTTINVVITAQDGVTTKTYSITVNRTLSNNAALSGLYTLSDEGEDTGLSPAFDPNITSYTTTLVDQRVIQTYLGLTPITSDPNATVTVNGTVVDQTEGINVQVPTGVTTPVNVVVTSQDGTATKTYTVNVTREPSVNDQLMSLTTSYGTPTFNTNAYYINTGTTPASITVTAVAEDPTATVQINGVAVTQGTASGPIAMAAGSNQVIITVIAQNGTTKQNTSLFVSWPGYPNALLSSLNPSASTLTPAFNSNTTNYTISVPYSISSITMAPVRAYSGETMAVNGLSVGGGGTASQPIQLAAGTSTTINVVVTAADGVNTMTYTVIVTRALSAVSTLSSLAPKYGLLTPVFSSSTTTYGLSVDSVVSSVNFTPVATDADAIIKINGIAVPTGTISAPIPVAQGVVTTVNVVVTSQDGTTIQTYTVNVTHKASGTTSAASLSGIGPQYGPLAPAFAPGTTSYILSVSNATATMTVKPAVTNAGSTIKVNGTALSSGSTSAPIALTAGAVTVINIVVKAPDGITTRTYTISVSRAAPNSNIATLSAMGPKYGPLTPVFAPATTSYTLSVSYGTPTMTVQPVATEPHATIKVNGTALTPGTTSAPIALAEGATTAINVVVTAQDGVTTKTYTINVSRGPSNIASLSALGPQYGPLSPVFASATTSYTLSVSNATKSMTVKPVTTDANATLKVNGTAVSSGATSAPVALAVGLNTITVIVTAQDGKNTKTYTINVTRAAGGADSFDPGISVSKPIETPGLAEDGIVVHQGISPNGDGINDFLQIDNISQYPDNKLMIMNRNGQMIYEAKGYDNSAKLFDGHSNKNGQMQLPGTYFYQLDYTVKGVVKHKTGFVVLKY